MDIILKDTIVIINKINKLLVYTIPHTNLESYIQSINNISLQWKTVGRTLTSKERKEFFNNNIQQLHYIHENLVGTTIKTYHKKYINLFRSAHDTIFASLDIKRPVIKFKQLPTLVFTEFLKGITYFKTDIIYETPIYHRSNSCSTGTLTIRDKFGRKTIYSDEAALTNISYIQRCYIERQIYNEIFKSILYKQDVSHLKELETIKRLYDTKVHNNSLTLIVNHYDPPAYIHPTQLHISYSNTHKEIYIKQPLSNIVLCEKQENGVMYHKTQTFEKEMPWLIGPLSYKDKYKIKPLSI
jgi:hypothetical protein